MFDTKLPQPNGSFDWVQVGGRAALVCRPLQALAPHLMTTRAWQLGTSATADAEAAWEELASAAGAPIVRVHQVHGADVVIRRKGDGGGAGTNRPVGDVIVSDDSTVALAIQTADCVPILIASRRSRAIAAAHAGWRGLAARVPHVTVDALVREFGGDASDLVAAVGPSIRACCYEVGEEVRQAFEESGYPRSAIDRWFFPSPRATHTNPPMPGLHDTPRAGHCYFDSAAAARGQLESAGVPRDQIFVAGLCTASHSVLCSYRRDGSSAGRMAAAVTAAPPHRP
jgi:YfiH family protein